MIMVIMGMVIMIIGMVAIVVVVVVIVVCVRAGVVVVSFGGIIRIAGACRVDRVSLLVALRDITQALAALDLPDGPAQRMRRVDASGGKCSWWQHRLVLASQRNGRVVAGVVVRLRVVELADPEAWRLRAGSFEDVEGHVVDFVWRVDAEGGG